MFSQRILILRLTLFDNQTHTILFADEKALPEPHQAADERIHGVLPHREEEDRRVEPRYPQRRDLQTAWKKVGYFGSPHISR